MSQQIFSIKTYTGHILGFVGHPVSVSIIQLCHCIAKAAIDDPYMNGYHCPNKTLFTQTGGGMGSMDSGCFLTPGVRHVK